MQTQPLLSVIVPVYNVSEFLPRCLDSLIGQTYSNLDIILVDDGSVDESPKICDDYARKDPRIRVIHKENAGAGFARNSGLDMARGEYVAFCDSDDYADVDMYRRLMSIVVKEKTDAVYCDFSVVRSGDIIESGVSVVPAGTYTGKEMLLNMLGACPEGEKDSVFNMSVWRSVYSRDVIETHGIRFSSERYIMSEDLFFNIDFLSRAERVIHIKDRLYFYCETDGSLTHRFIDERLKQEKNLYHAVCRRVEDVLQGEQLLRWQRLFLGRIRSTIGQYVYYAEGRTFIQRLREIRRIANDDLVRDVIGSYPIRKNPLKLRIFNTFLKWKFCTGMYLLLVCNNR